VGVTHQYCGQLGKTTNCQVAVSLSLASEHGSVPIGYRLYVPKDWADDTAYSLNDLADGVRASFIRLENLERWASEQTLLADETEHVEYLCQAIRDRRVEARLNRMIGACIRAATLHPTTNFLSPLTRRHAYELRIDEGIRRKTKLNKRIALDLVFLSPALQQLDHKADRILGQMFAALRETYLSGTPGLHLLPAEMEKALATAADQREAARFVCDWIANMTDSFAFRAYRRMFDADYGSITDLV
jgi:dGTPase